MPGQPRFQCALRPGAACRSEILHHSRADTGTVDRQPRERPDLLRSQLSGARGSAQSTPVEISEPAVAIDAEDRAPGCGATEDVPAAPPAQPTDLQNLLAREGTQPECR